MDDATFSERLAAEPPPESGLDGARGPEEDSPLSEDDGREPPFAAAGGGAASSVVSVEFNSEIVSADHLAIAGQIFNQHFTLAAAGEAIELSTRHFTFRTSRRARDLRRGAGVRGSGDRDAAVVAGADAIAHPRRRTGGRQGKPRPSPRLNADPDAARRGDAHLSKARLQRPGRSRESRGRRALQPAGRDVRGRPGGGKFRPSRLSEDSRLPPADDAPGAPPQEFGRDAADRVLRVARGFERRLESLGHPADLTPPAPDLLHRALHSFSARLPQQGGRGEAVRSFLADHATDLARELRTIPRIARFVHEYLAEVAAGNLPLHQALGRMDDLSQWLTADLAGDLDAQAAVLALVFGSAVPPAAGMPFFAFDDLRRRITELLRRELRLPEDQPSSPAGLGRAFLDRARAHVSGDALAATGPRPLPGRPLSSAALASYGRAGPRARDPDDPAPARVHPRHHHPLPARERRLRPGTPGADRADRPRARLSSSSGPARRRRATSCRASSCRAAPAATIATYQEFLSGHPPRPRLRGAGRSGRGRRTQPELPGSPRPGSADPRAVAASRRSACRSRSTRCSRSRTSARHKRRGTAPDGRSTQGLREVERAPRREPSRARHGAGSRKPAPPARSGPVRAGRRPVLPRRRPGSGPPPVDRSHERGAGAARSALRLPLPPSAGPVRSHRPLQVALRRLRDGDQPFSPLLAVRRARS